MRIEHKNLFIMTTDEPLVELLKQKGTECLELLNRASANLVLESGKLFSKICKYRWDSIQCQSDYLDIFKYISFNSIKNKTKFYKWLLAIFHCKLSHFIVGLQS